MPYDAPGQRVTVTATKSVVSGKPAAESGFVGIAAKVKQLTRFQDPELLASRTIEVGEEFELFVTGVHEVELAGGLSTAIVGDKLYVNTTDNSVEQDAAPAGTNETQTVTVTGDGGTYTLTFDGETTGNIAHDATAAAVATALKALSNVDDADVAATGDPGGPYVVTFQGQYSGENVSLLTADATNLTDGEGPGSVAIAETTAGAAGDDSMPLGVIQQIDTARTPDVARVNLNNWQAFAS